MEEKNIFNRELLLNKRKEFKLSQEELAEKLDVSRQTVYAWESGKSIPDTRNISKLCEVFNLNTNEVAPQLNGNKIKNLRKFKNILILVTIFIMILYLAYSISKFTICNEINKKLDLLSNLNNYYYKEKIYKTKNLKAYDYSISETYYKDGILKMMHDNSIVWIDYNQNYGYTFDTKNKTYSELSLDELLFPKENGIKMLSSIVFSKSDFENFIWCLNPNVIYSKKNKEYLIKHSVKVGDLKIKVEEKRNKETGVPIRITEYGNDGINLVKEYDIKINENLDENLECPNIEEYTRKR